MGQDKGVMLRLCPGDRDAPVARQVFGLQQVGQQGDGMPFRAVVAAFDQAEPEFLGPAGYIVFDFRSQIEIGASFAGNSSEVRAAAAAECDGGHCLRQPAGNGYRGQVKGLPEAAEEDG